MPWFILSDLYHRRQIATLEFRSPTVYTPSSIIISSQIFFLIKKNVKPMSFVFGKRTWAFKSYVIFFKKMQLETIEKGLSLLENDVLVFLIPLN